MKREKRIAKASKKRKEQTRSMIVRFLIVCEGTKTEPNYFRALIRDKYSEVRSEEILGAGCSTCKLIDRILEIKDELEQNRQLSFDRVWAVFDKDDFQDFNEAIEKAHKLHFNCAWTNEAFELWYFLHFQYVDAKISRKDYIDRLQQEIRKHKGYADFVYKKNDPGIYKLLNDLGNEDFAKSNANRLRELFKENTDYKNHQPCTRVDLLVNELENPQTVLEINTEV